MVATGEGKERIEDASGQEPRSRTRAAIYEALLLAILPLALYVVLRPEPYFLQNGVDPFIYVGYMENLPDLIMRFGLPYYAVRFGLILPGRLFLKVFGPVAGNLLLHYLLALLRPGRRTCWAAGGAAERRGGSAPSSRCRARCSSTPS